MFLDAATQLLGFPDLVVIEVNLTPDHITVTVTPTHPAPTHTATVTATVTATA